MSEQVQVGAVAVFNPRMTDDELHVAYVHMCHRLVFAAKVGGHVLAMPSVRFDSTPWDAGRIVVRVTGQAVLS